MSIVDRADVERAENWREIMGQMPDLEFPSGWRVAVIPPFSGAVARFVVKQGDARVSVYADWFENLAYYGEPYWEIYPYHEDVWRCPIADAGALIDAIAESLAVQNSTTSRKTDPGRMS